MFSSKAAHSVMFAAASAVASSERLDALTVSGNFDVGVRLIPGLERTDRAAWESHVVRLRGVPCVSLGNGAFVTAAHVAPPSGAFDHYRVRAHDSTACDLLLFRHAEGAIQNDQLLIADRVDRSRRELLVVATHSGHGLTYPTAATNVVTSGVPTEGLNPPLVLLTPKYGVPGAGTVEVGDSGGGVFRFDSVQRRWALVGIVAAKAKPTENRPDPEPLSGSYAVAIDTTLATGVGRQLIEYREGAIRGGELADRFSRTEKVAVGVGVIGLIAAAGAGAIARGRSTKS